MGLFGFLLNFLGLFSGGLTLGRFFVHQNAGLIIGTNFQNYRNIKIKSKKAKIP